MPLPSASRDDMDAGSPCPEDGGFFYARPDAEDTEEAINKFLEGGEPGRSWFRQAAFIAQQASRCSMLRLWKVAFCPGTAEAVYAF